jgi:alpha-ribazole phosphatase
MQIYLIRHTTPAVDKGICYGQTDIPINFNLFDAELEVIKKALPADINHIYCSPLQRCTFLANKLSSNISYHPELKELNFGDWEMQKWTELITDEFNNWMQDFVSVKTKNGESYEDLHFRTIQFLNNILNQKEDKVAIITHAGNIRSIISHLIDLPLSNSFRIEVNYGAVIHIELFENNMLNKLISIKNGK